MVKIKPVRLVKRGNNYQIYYYNPQGERRRISVGDDYDYAQRLVDQFNDWLVECKDPENEIKKIRQKEIAKASSIQTLFSIFMKRHAKFKSTAMQVSYLYSFKNICRCPALLNANIGSVTKSLVLDYMHARMENDGVTSSTVNREAAFMKCMFSKAVEWDILDNNPLHGLRLFPENNNRDVNLTVSQAKRLIEILPGPVADIVEFAIYTGFRKENILSLRIESICFHDLTQTGQVKLIVKGNRSEEFPLGLTAIELLKHVIGDRNEGYVFINPKTGTRYFSIKKSFNRAVRRLGLEVNGTKLRFHDLRHVFATWLHQQGVSLDALRPLMGHKNRSTTDRYITIDRLAAGKLLSNMPRIRNHENKKALTDEESRPAINDF